MKTKLVREMLQYRRSSFYAWPGGYQISGLMADGECLCRQCLESNIRLIASATMQEDNHSGWMLAGWIINLEDPALYCAHCNEKIKPEHGGNENG